MLKTNVPKFKLMKNVIKLLMWYYLNQSINIIITENSSKCLSTDWL